MGSGITCTVYVRPSNDGPLVRLADGAPTDDPDAPTVLTDLKVSWGRETSVDQPSASTCAFKVLDLEGGTEFLDLISLGTPVVVTAPLPGNEAGDEVTVFTGRVSSLTHSWDDALDGPVAQIDTIDFTADLENTIVGSDPWPVQTVAVRFRTIADATSLTDWTIDSTLSSTLLSYRDVDAQGAMGLLSEIASSVDGILWSTASEDGQTTRLYLEDPQGRPSSETLQFDEADRLVEIVPVANLGQHTLSVCDVLRDGVEWVQDVQDVTSRVSVTWREQTADEDGNPAPTDRTYTAIDTAREDNHGQRGISLSSQLQSELDATNVANQILARTAGTSWRITGLTIDDAVNTHTLPTVATNYVNDPSAEYDGIDWTGDTAPVQSKGTIGAHTGRGRYRYTTLTDYSTTAIAVQVPDDAATITVSAWYTSSVVGLNYQQQIGGGGTVPTDSPVYTVTTAERNDYVFRSLTTTAVPGGTAYFYPVVALTPTNPGASQLIYVDDFAVTFGTDPSDTAPADFNGDTPDTSTYIYDWTGTPGASPSTRTTSGGPTEYLATMTALLDASTRNGAAIQLADLPSWAITDEVGVYLEGGSYTYTATGGGQPGDAAWILDLTVSNPAGLGHSVTWGDLRLGGAFSWAWTNFDPAIAWTDLYGVGSPATVSQNQE